MVPPVVRKAFYRLAAICLFLQQPTIALAGGHSAPEASTVATERPLDPGLLPVAAAIAPGILLNGTIPGQASRPSIYRSLPRFFLQPIKYLVAC